MSSQWPLLLASFAIALVLSIPFLAFQVLQLRRMSRVKPFPFLRLPPELRNIVYEHLIEQDPWYSPTSSTAKAAPAFDWPLRRKQPSIKKNAIMFTSRQVYDEFTDVLCKKATFILTVDQDSKDNRSLWPIRPDTLKKIRRCDLRIKIGSGMLGALDPRSVPKEWPIREQIWKTLKGMEKTEDLRLHIQAIGDPLWNPLWLWYHTAQAFRESGEPAFQSITFSLESWASSANHLGRKKGGAWEWRCIEDHVIANDPGQWQPIREFCAALYADCETCNRAREAGEGQATTA